MKSLCKGLLSGLSDQYLTAVSADNTQPRRGEGLMCPNGTMRQIGRRKEKEQERQWNVSEAGGGRNKGSAEVWALVTWEGPRESVSKSGPNLCFDLSCKPYPAQACGGEGHGRISGAGCLSAEGSNKKQNQSLASEWVCARGTCWNPLHIYHDGKRPLTTDIPQQSPQRASGGFYLTTFAVFWQQRRESSVINY